MIKAQKYSYDSFLESASNRQWQKISTSRRAGVCIPLFSIYSQNSLGIGEIPDLELLIDWCNKTGLSIIQLLPLNDTGFNYTPYDSESSFALDPIYLSLNKLIDVTISEKTKEEIKLIKLDESFSGQYINYKIKKIKLELLWRIFQRSDIDSKAFINFTNQNSFWLENYALYKAIKDENWQASWDKWDNKSSKASPSRVKFYTWLQWQLFEQFKAVKKYAESKNILIFGDIPLYVSYDSADTWAHPKYFHLDRASGVPPDALSDKGQRWGMPTYNWQEQANNNYDYYKNKLKYAENFYDIFRIDHAIGLFRAWSVDRNDDLANGSRNGRFDLNSPAEWYEQGKRLYQVMLDNTLMLPCAEDLGAVPDCCFQVQDELKIPGIEVQRWKRKNDGSFSPGEEYRKHSMSLLSTHDMSHFALWWNQEANLDEKNHFLNFCGSYLNTNFLTSEYVCKKALELCSNSASIFNIQLIHDWLALGNYEILKQEPSRINFPGLVLDQNWSIRMPISLEIMNNLEINSIIHQVNQNGLRTISNYVSA